MKRRIIGMLGMFLFASFALIAQPGSGDRDKMIKEQKATFIQNKLKLTPAEAEKFWPIYNKHAEELKALKDKSSLRIDGPVKDLSDADIEAKILNMLDMEEKINEANRAYFANLKTAIPMRKIARLMMAERSFNREMLKRLREMRNSNKQE